MPNLSLATLALLLLVGVADMLWSPALMDRPPARQSAAEEARQPGSPAEAVDLYRKSAEPWEWEQRRLAASFLLKRPLSERGHWEALGRALEKDPPPLSAWEVWQASSFFSPPASGLFGAYQNRLASLRQAQLQAAAEPLRETLQKSDYAAYQQALPRLGDSSGPLWLALSLQPQLQICREDLLPDGWWWALLLNQSQHQALLAGVRLARGEAP